MNEWGKAGKRSARLWIFLFIALAMLNPPAARSAETGLEVMFGAWGKVDDDPQARGCRLYANKTDGDYFVLSKGYVESGGDCVCVLEGMRQSSDCFDIDLFCRCGDGFTVRRRDPRLCPTATRSKLDVTEDGETVSYERCKGRR